MVSYNRGDIDFILAQIKIAEQNATRDDGTPGTPLDQLVSNPLLPFGLRTVDGTNNNIIDGRENYGSADNIFPRLVPAELNSAGTVTFDPDGPGGQTVGQSTTYAQTTGAVFDPQIRLASNSVVDQSLNNPAAILAALKVQGIEGEAAQTALAEIQAAATAPAPGAVTAAYIAAAGESEAAKNAAAVAKAATNAIETALATSPATASTLTVINTAISAANTALIEAQQLVAALSVAGVNSGDLAAAQQLQISAQTLFNELTLVRDGTAPAGTNPNNGIDAGQGVVIQDIQRFVNALQAADALQASATSVDQQIDAAANTLTNGELSLADVLEKYGLELTESGSLFIGNIAPDEGISAPFNSWMTLFGQFFDHGLDLVTKGGGTVFVPLAPDDPLYNSASPQTNFMALTRATNQPGQDGILGTADDVHEHTNTTTPFVDQNQTYTSHASHQVFLREYTRIADGADAGTALDIVATGRLLNGATGGLPTWADVKAQAANVLGLRLTDVNVGDVPLLATDEYGRFLRGPNGFAQVVVKVSETVGATTVVRNVLVEGRATDANDNLAGLDLRSISLAELPASFVPTPGATVTTITVQGTGHAFLDDIAHTANPYFSDGTMRLADNNTTIGDHFVQAGDDGREMANREGPTRGGSTSYDNELLDRHFITGDGRGNENIGLTAVHHVFHSEHNRLMEHTKATVIDTRDLAFIREWVLPQFQNLVPTNPNQLNSEGEETTLLNALNAANAWNGERLFQAARFGTEMQYQHMVFEEFARKVNPMVDLFIFNPTMDIDPAIFAEFAHVVYRFGHSMLNETVDRLDPSAQTADDIALFDAFLNPLEFDANGSITHEEAAGAIIRGMTQQRGNAIDEFVTDALRNNLVGLPLDLATLNMARARETGVPSLNHAREAFYEMTKSEWLKPYVSWTDFAESLKNPASIVNFIAAYGTHASITSATLLEDKRAAAELLVFGGTGAPADRLAFLNGQGAYGKANGLGGLDSVDFWLGGLAEEILPFGGMLGSTFTFVFEAQMEKLQNADRFYYLSRTQGLHFITELENNSFASIVKKNTDLGMTIANDQVVPNAAGTNGSSHLPGELFANPDLTLEVNQNFQQDYNGAAAGKDPSDEDPVLEALQPKVFRVNDNGGATPNINVTNHPDAIKVVDTAELLRKGALTAVQAPAVNTLLDDNNTYDNLLKFRGGEHVVLGGTDERDVLIGDLGDDTIWGDGGNDLIIGGHGINRLHGGEGDDIIYGGGDPEFIHGEGGNDAIQGGNGLGDLIFAGDGADFVVGGIDGKEVFAGQGNDFVLGSPDVDFLLGGEGDDWLEGAEGFDTIAGENSELFFNSAIVGHDVMFSGTNEMDFDAESGDDIMVQGESVMRNEGMFGFDWVSFEEHTTFGADADMRIKIFTTVENDILRNRFDQVEAMSGSALDDVLIGDDRVSATALDPGEPAGAAAETTLIDSELTREGVNRIAGLQQVLGLTNAQVGGDQTLVAFDAGNILLGGDGNDIIQGGGGNDIIDGDKHLNVRIGIYSGNNQIGTVEKMQGAVHFYTAAEAAAKGAGHTAASAALQALNGQQLDTLVFSRVVNPGDLRIVREILNDTTQNNTAVAGYNGDVDTAVFQGNIAEYTLRNAAGVIISAPGNVIDLNTSALNLRGRITVEHTAPANGGGVADDGIDTLENIERLQFADGTLELVPGLNARPVGTASVRTLLDATGAAVVQTGLPLLVATNADGSLAGVTDADNPGGRITNFTVRWQVEATAGAGDFVDTGAVGLAFVPDAALALNGERIRAVITYDGANGERESVATAPTAPIDPATNLADTAGPDIVVGLHDIPNTAANQAFRTAALAAGITAAQLGFTLPQAGNDGTLNGPLNGGLDDDEVHGLSGNDILDGDAGDDLLFGGTGNDQLFGDRGANNGEGNDILDGGAGNDTAIFDDAIGDYTLALNAEGDLEVVNADGSEDAVLNIEQLLFRSGTDITLNVADVTATLQALALDPLTDPGEISIAATGGDDVLAGTAGVNTINGQGGNDLIFGLGGADALSGGAGDDEIRGGAGNDTIFGNGGSDLIVWNAGDGRDLINGDTGAGNNGADVDTVEVNGNGTAETFRVVAVNTNGNQTLRNQIQTNFATTLAATTEIVVIRQQGVNPAEIIAELDNIEELVINGVTTPATGGPAGNDNVIVQGDFTNTSLALATITINGSTGDDSVDITGLSSAHRIVFRTNGGDDVVVGALRPQDVVELAPGLSPDDYGTPTYNGNGTWTISQLGGTHSVTYSGGPSMSQPTFVAGGSYIPDSDDDDDDHDDDGVDPPIGDDDDCGVDTDDDASPAQPSSSVLSVASATSRTLVGGTASETLFGDDSADNLVGQGGADQVFGRGGNDIVIGGDGDDHLDAGSGDDTVIGGGGRDQMFAGDGNDLVFAAAGEDMVWAGAGNDTIFLKAGSGEGQVRGEAGVDTLDLSSLTANTTVDLDSGQLSSGGATMVLSGIEHVIGGRGNDTIVANASHNVLEGGAGNDTFVFRTAADANGDQILGFQAGDKIDFRALFAGVSTPDLEIAHVGADTVISGVASGAEFAVTVVDQHIDETRILTQ